MYKVIVILEGHFVIERHGYEMLKTEDHRNCQERTLYYKYSSFPPIIPCEEKL